MWLKLQYLAITWIIDIHLEKWENLRKLIILKD